MSIWDQIVALFQVCAAIEYLKVLAGVVSRRRLVGHRSGRKELRGNRRGKWKTEEDGGRGKEEEE